GGDCGALCGARGLDVKAHAFSLLKIGDDLEQVARLRIAGGSEHAHEAFGRAVNHFGKFNETHSRVDIVAQDGLAGAHVAGKQTLDTFAEKFLAKRGVALGTGLDRFSEVSR